MHSLILLASAGDQITIEELEVIESMEDIFTNVGTVVTKFMSDVLTPVFNTAISNNLCLIFLGVSFVGIGIRYMKRITRAFGRGR